MRSMVMTTLLLLSLLLLCAESRTIYQTSPDDIDGLKAMAKKFTFIQSMWFDFGGDPCEELFGWPWLVCSNSTPPRVTALFLARYSLDAELPVFSQMKALETIDFSDNSLHGSIPSFLGKLPNLKQLDLSNNQLSGNIPWSIVDHQNLTYNLYGNPKLEPPKKEKEKKKNLGLLIGVPVGLLFGLVLPGLTVFLLTRRKTLPSPSQATTGTMRVNNIENGSSSGISTEKLNHPPPSLPQVYNQVEVNQLLQLHSNNYNDTRRR